MSRVKSTANERWPEALMKAFRKAKRTLHKDPVCIASSVSAGYVLPPRAVMGKGVMRAGFQVFVEVARFDERLLRDRPDTGGLVKYCPKHKTQTTKEYAR